MKYIIGVDGGGTKTEAVAYNLNGEKLGVSLKGYANLLNGREEALKNILSSISDLTDKFGIEGVEGLYLGIAGSEVGNNANIIGEEIKNKLSLDSVVMNDGELALRAILKGEDGILTIAGTGSIAFGIRENKSFRCGGWGHLLGDEGSGYKIAIDGIKRMIFEQDNSLEKSNMSKLIMKDLNINSVDEIVEFVYSSSKDEIAKITPIIAKLGEEGDPIAKEILIKEGKDLAKTTENVYKKLNFNSCYIGLVGGVIKKAKVLRETFEECLKNNINVDGFIDEEVSAAKGAYYIYKKSLN
ncbi:N-acetylglucosamine kinase [Clostridium fallax]|uniref:BadF-type ATPase n=1 Tax=Clostridium fallax TaxID=1533 RepID=A0A1M4WGP1_9CLOT|nr:BadF/BadG/BcrA/BcrD ATPase family protein [Clostridium fallax]SHE80122.1 BadF-type ATPase [Clostridium fallax]SQB04949.1 BadF/BadG/BcrA/BcrD type ATPase [Clostridium fallax]